MPDFAQRGPITTLHDLGTVEIGTLEAELRESVRRSPIGLVLPITASDMRAAPFANITQKLGEADYVDTVTVVLNRADSPEDYREAARLCAPMGDRVQLLWTDGPRGTAALNELLEAGFDVSKPGKGRAVWFAFGHLLADIKLKAFVLQDGDIVGYDNEMLIRLSLPMAHPGMDFDFCKAYYARCTNKMHGRVVRLLVVPFVRALITVMGNDPYLVFLRSFRYPLAGEFAITSTLARSNRIPCDWGLEVGTLSEVFRNTSPKRVAQVDIARLYEHKHQPLSLEDPTTGLMKMASDILRNIIRTLASRGTVFGTGHFISLRSAYLRLAQDAIRQYHADSLMNGLDYDRHSEEQAIEGFAELITQTGQAVSDDPSGEPALPTWTRVMTAFPEFPLRLREIVKLDREEYLD
ncbi:Glucosyl-3-phosphoglycerate synthase [Posidoniimonas polymericola]|uniref:Glucosyl-3-phosphoglycerate synthase n=1 Tax=Posidoniimonas polymericola TaxID=2528002 RepID=A0A5C5XY30_9BACT|nr:glycosyl transferase [Posidoniimonas polymericola]TWT66825.1 Glucosyl-3-phosphoglycerate synthase [Posidoniimonas polymericola]